MSTINVSSGSTYSNATAANDAITVYDGGIVTAAVLSGAGAFEKVSSGGVVSGTTVYGGAYQTVSSGGVVSGTTLSIGGVQNVSSGGVVIATTVSSGGAEFVSSGGVVSGATIIRYGVETVYSGGVASGTTLSGGGVQNVSSGGVVIGAQLSGSAGSNPAQIVWAGGIARGTTLVTSALQNVSSGGVAVGVTVNSSGATRAFAGGVISGATVNYLGKMILVASAGGVTGGVGSGTTVNSGGSQMVQTGAVAITTTVSSGGSQVVSSGGTVSGTTISNGGTLQVITGGTLAAATMLLSGGVLVASGDVTNTGTFSLYNQTATITGTLLNNGNILIDPSSLTVANLSGTGTVTIDAGSTLTVTGTIASTETIVFTGSTGELDIAASGAAGTISGLTAGNIISITGATASGISVSGSVLQITTSTGTTSLTLNTSAYDTTRFSFTNVSGNTQIANTICYLRGTKILTESGEIAIEDLRAGDRLVTRFGGLRPLQWVGRQRFNGRFLGQTNAPVCFHAGSIADNVPSRDLYVSPAHSMVIDDHLVGACLLVNGVTITQTATDQIVDYFHLDFGVHDCVIADGAWSETYAEQHNRTQFHNLAAFQAEFPDHRAEPQPYCLPQLGFGDAGLGLARAQLLARVPAAAFTTDADVHLVVDGARIDPTHHDASGWVFDVPTGAVGVRLMSRATVPALGGLNADERHLGICIDRLIIVDGGITMTMDPGHQAVRTGLHPQEGPRSARWTNGICPLPDMMFSGYGSATMLRLTVHGTTLARYLDAEGQASRLAA